MNVYTKERNWAKLKFIYTIQKYLNGNFGCKFSAFCQKASKQTRRPTVKIVFKLFITSNNTVWVHEYNLSLNWDIKIIVTLAGKNSAIPGAIIYILLLCQAADIVYEKCMKFAIKRE